MEGAAELDESAFSSDNVSVTLEHTVDGKVKATVTRRVEDNAPYHWPRQSATLTMRRLAGDGSPHLSGMPYLSGDSFFIRVKIR